MNRRSLILVIAAIVVVGAAYYYLHGKVYVYRFTEARLKEKAFAYFPIEKSYLLILQAKLENPRLSLPEGGSRVRAGLDLVLNVSVDRNAVPLNGFVDVSGGIRYDPANGQLFLTDPVVEALQVNGISDKYAEIARHLIVTVLTDRFARHPIYTLSRLNTKEAMGRLVLKSVVVEHQQLVVTLGI